MVLVVWRMCDNVMLGFAVCSAHRRGWLREEFPLPLRSFARIRKHPCHNPPEREFLSSHSSYNRGEDPTPAPSFLAPALFVLAVVQPLHQDEELFPRDLAVPAVVRLRNQRLELGLALCGRFAPVVSTPQLVR